jgi:hypothetical protein
MSTFLSVICLSILTVPVLLAADQKAAPPAPKAKPEDSAPAEIKKPSSEQLAAIALKNTSAFKIDSGARNPFWPIGFKPTGKIAGAGGSAQGEVPPGSFLVSSITLDGATRFAIINGKSMSEGQQFGLQVGTQIYQVSVRRIEDGRVILSRGDEEIVVPLRRK